MGHEQGRREPLWRRMRAEYDRVTLNCCRIEAMGSRRVLVQGCEEILAYGRECICLGIRDPDVRVLAINGRELVCLTYHPDAVVVEGEICTLRFCCDVHESQNDREAEGKNV